MAGPLPCLRRPTILWLSAPTGQYPLRPVGRSSPNSYLLCQELTPDSSLALLLSAKRREETVCDQGGQVAVLTQVPPPMTCSLLRYLPSVIKMYIKEEKCDRHLEQHRSQGRTGARWMPGAGDAGTHRARVSDNSCRDPHNGRDPLGQKPRERQTRRAHSGVPTAGSPCPQPQTRCPRSGNGPRLRPWGRDRRAAAEGPRCFGDVRSFLVVTRCIHLSNTEQTSKLQVA